MDKDIQLLIKQLKATPGNNARLEYLKGQDSDVLARFVFVLFQQIGTMAGCARLDDLHDDLMKEQFGKEN